MSNPIIKIVDASTGEEIERPMNAKELADWKEQNELTAKFKAEADAKAAARQSALEKLAALGLTADEIAALAGGN